MADASTHLRELVFCHACENEWQREEHGLECPECHSDIVEIVERDNDPRDNRVDLTADHNGPSEQRRSDSPWQQDADDPEEGNIDHISFSPAPVVRFERTFIRSSSPQAAGSGAHPRDDMITPIFQTLSTLFEGATNPSTRPPNPGFPRNGLQMVPPHQYPPPYSMNHVQPLYASFQPNGAGQYAPRIHNMPPPAPGTQPINHLHTVIAAVLGAMQNSADHPGPAAGGPGGNPFHVFAQMFNPGNAVLGDAVYTEQALDRIISDLMEQNDSSSGPGPASAAAIAALPKRKADVSMMGHDGKAECSVCMDAVAVGTEVTVLPCHHWFHEDCVGAWLREHDTCPHCRQSITPKEGPTDTPRSPNQSPLHNQGLPRFATSPVPTRSFAQPMPGAFTPLEATDSYSRDEYTQRPEVHVATPPQSYVNPPFEAHTPTPDGLPHRRSHPQRRRSSASPRGSNATHGNGNSENNASSNSGVRGWFRNMRGASGSSDRSS